MGAGARLSGSEVRALYRRTSGSHTRPVSASLGWLDTAPRAGLCLEFVIRQV